MSQALVLLGAFGATESDLAANQDGILTAEQKQRLLAATSGDATFMGGFAIFFAAVMYGVLYMIVDSGKVFEFSDGVSLAEGGILLAAGGLPTAGILWGIYVIFIHQRARGATSVEKIEGTASPKVLRHRQAVVYQLTIGGQTFDLTALAHERIESGQPYRAYFEPRSNVVVAMERIEN